MTTTAQDGPAVHTAPSLTGISHVGLTVRDVATSEAWYTEVLGLARVFVEPHSAGEGYAVVMTRPGTERRTGLDHLALAVESREDLDRWARRLEARGIAHSEMVEVDEPAPHAQMTLRDPDGIPIEVFWLGGH